MLTANSTPLNGVRNALKSCWYQLGGFSCVTSLRPYCCRLALTCSSVRPLLLACKRASASSGAHVHSSGIREVMCLLSIASDAIARHTISLFIVELLISYYPRILFVLDFADVE